MSEKERKTCEVEDCENPQAGKGYCKSHYYRWKRYGDPLGTSASKRGRPLNHKLSQETKDKIGRSKLGHKHSEETKDKISEGVKKYFRKKYPLSDELAQMYGDIAMDWIEEHEEEINAIDDVRTLSRMRTANRIEYTIGPVIEILAVNNITPELLVLAKEAMEENKNEEGEEEE